MRPNFGHVENVSFISLGILGVHDLDIDIPLGVVAFLNGLEEILDVMVRVLASNLGSGFAIVIANALLRLDVDLDIVEGTVVSSELVGAPTESIHLAERSGNVSVAKKMHELVNAFGVANVKTAGRILALPHVHLNY